MESPSDARLSLNLRFADAHLHPSAHTLYISFTIQNIPMESNTIWNIPLTTADSSHGGYFEQPDSRLAGEGIHQ
jgi:hypothetical protein